jgi:ankyrin repeat protein
MGVDLYQAARSGDLAGLRSYAASGGELNARRPGQLQRTALHVAIESGQGDAARVLIELGADIRAADYRGARPLHYAAGMGHLAVVEMLLDRGAEPGALNIFGETALHSLAAGGGLASEDDKVCLVRRLIAAGVPADAVGNAGRTPLWYAAARGKAAVAAAPLRAGADPARRTGGKLGSAADVATGGVVELLRRG